MSYSFASEEWIDAFKNEINSSQQYKQSAANWEAGAICLVVKAGPSGGLTEDRHIFLDLHRGECNEAKAVDAERASEAKFTFSADYDQWKRIFHGELDPVQAMMMGQLSVDGDISVLMMHTQAAKDLIQCGAQVPTLFGGD